MCPQLSESFLKIIIIIHKEARRCPEIMVIVHAHICACTHAHTHTPRHTRTTLSMRHFRKSVSNNVNPERCRNVRHITWAGRAVGIWLPAGEASSRNSFPRSLMLSLSTGKGEEGKRGRADIVYYVFFLTAGEGLRCAGLGWLVAFSSLKEHKRKSNRAPSSRMGMGSQPLLIISVAGAINASLTASYGDSAAPPRSP